MTFINKILEDDTLEQLFKSSYLNIWEDYFAKREHRKNQALIEFLSEFDTVPKLSYDEVVTQLEKLQNLYQKFSVGSYNNIEILENSITNLQEKLANNDYYIENSADHHYRQSYDAKLSNFVWPSEEEKILRSQEEDEIMLLLQESN